MTDFLQFIVAGLSQGAIYALVALGFSLIYRATNIVNFAQGEFVMIGGLGTASGLLWGMPGWLALAMSLSIAVACAFLLHSVLVRLTRSASITLIIIVTIGASITLRGAAQIAWGGISIRCRRSPVRSRCASPVWRSCPRRSWCWPVPR